MRVLVVQVWGVGCTDLGRALYNGDWTAKTNAGCTEMQPAFTPLAGRACQSRGYFAAGASAGAAGAASAGAGAASAGAEPAPCDREYT